MSIQQSLSNISTALSDYASSQSGLWSGQSGTHIHNLCTEELMPRVQSITAKVEVLESAQEMAAELQSHIEKRNYYANNRPSFTKEDKAKKAQYLNYTNLMNQEDETINKLRQQIISMLKG